MYLFSAVKNTLKVNNFKLIEIIILHELTSLQIQTSQWENERQREIIAQILQGTPDFTYKWRKRMRLYV